MKLFSIYKHMEDGALAAPKDENIKIIFRHSIRESIRSGVGRDVPLTNEGIELARSFGRNLSRQIGFIASSSCDRNFRTCESILEGKKAKKEIVIASRELELPQIKDRSLSDKIFEEMNYQSDKVLLKLRMEGLPGFNSVEQSGKIILDYIFLHGNQRNEVDLFCTHDFQMAILYSYLFDFGATELSILQNKWPMMLEGMIFWGKRENFWCSWRGEIKNFVGM